MREERLRKREDGRLGGPRAEVIKRLGGKLDYGKEGPSPLCTNHTFHPTCLVLALATCFHNLHG